MRRNSPNCIEKNIQKYEIKSSYDNNLAQLLCVLNGGLLVQDVNNHALWGTHKITNGVNTYNITSTHHQMQYPYNLDENDYDVLYWANNLSKNYYCGEKINSELIIHKGEPEIVIYHKKGLPKCLAIQGHPEMMTRSNLHGMLNELIKRYGNL